MAPIPGSTHTGKSLQESLWGDPARIESPARRSPIC